MFSEQGKTFVLARAVVKTETEEQQKLKTKKKHGTKQETLKQVCVGYTGTKKRLELHS